MSLALRQEAIESKLIDLEHHDQLLADLASVCRQAGIPESYVWTSAKDYCGEKELNYVSMLKEDDCPLGMMYLGDLDGKPVNERMMAIAGACLRNYMNAKVMTVYDVMERQKDGDMPSPTVLLIPDFCDASRAAEWLRNSLLGMLYKREQEGKKTIIYVRNKKALEAGFEKPLLDHVNKFVKIKN